MIRNHVMNDLRPYVCTFMNCSQASETYASRSAFLDHEVHVHGKESRTLESSELSMQSLHEDCFFCGKVLPEAGLEERSRHVGRHMEEIAFTIVTKPYEDWEFYSDASTDLKPYRCKFNECPDTDFSSTACLLRHEREAHRMHGGNAFLCKFEGCERANEPYGFPRVWNRHDYMKRVHGYSGHGLPVYGDSSSPSQATVPDLERKEDRAYKEPRQRTSCHLCTEGKTFSREDALSRHMRVVHPDYLRQAEKG